jgi:hypothetical protein
MQYIFVASWLLRLTGLKFRVSHIAAVLKISDDACSEVPTYPAIVDRLLPDCCNSRIPELPTNYHFRV